MSADVLLEGLPDLVVVLRRDGIVLAHRGGRDVADLKPAADAIGKPIEATWSDSVAGLVKQLTRKAIALRTTTEARFEDRGRDYEARVSAQGPDRASCVIRALLTGARDGALEATDERPRPQLDRRGFLRRFKESMSLAALREKPIAVAVIYVDGVIDVLLSLQGKQLRAGGGRQTQLAELAVGGDGLIPDPRWICPGAHSLWRVRCGSPLPTAHDERAWPHSHLGCGGRHSRDCK